MEPRQPFTFIERIMLQHAHPLKLAFDFLGIALCIYFVWVHRLIPALVLVFGLSALGNVAVWRVDINELAATNLGKWMLGQTQPANLIIRTVGFAVVLVGVWVHSFLPMLGGVLIIVLARVVGRRWGRRATSND